MLASKRLSTLAALLVVLAPLCGLAQEATLVVTKAGYYLLTQDSAGVPSLVKIGNVIRLGEPSPDDPVDPTLTDRANAVREAAKAVQEPKREETARKLAIEYRVVAKQVETGQLATEPLILLAAKTAADIVLAQQQAVQQWQAVRGLLSTEWAKLVQEGAQDVAYGALLVEAAEGLEASTRE